MRTPSYDPAELERQIGARGDTAVNSTNRHLVQNWLVANGVPSARAKAMKVATLWKCYNKPKYLAAVQAHISGVVRDGDIDVATYRDAERDVIDAADAGAVETPAVITHATAYPAPGDAAAQLAMLIQSLSAGALDETRVIELIRLHAPEPAEREKLIVVSGQERRALPPAIRHHSFERVLRWSGAGVPVMLIGPAGTGKTHMCEQVAEALGLRYGFMGAASSRYDLSGYTDAGGAYRATSLFPDFYENGGLLLWDEVDNSDPASLPWANTALANGYCAFGDRIVRRHPDFRLVAAANTYGRGADRLYVGRNPIDAAVTDRFAFVTVDYDEAMETALFGATAWTERVQQVRRAIGALKLRHVVSMRASDYGARALACGAPQHEVEEDTLWKGLEPDQIAAIERAIQTEARA